MNRFRRLKTFTIATLGMFGLARSAHAADYVWNGTTSDVSFASNWTPAGGPPGAASGANTNAAHFGNTGVTSVSQGNVNFWLIQMYFDANAPAYTYTGTSGTATYLSIFNSGADALVNNSANQQVINITTGKLGLAGFINTGTTPGGSLVINTPLSFSDSSTGGGNWVSLKGSNNVYFNVATSVNSAGNINGGTWTAGALTTNMYTRARNRFFMTTFSGTAFLGNIGTTYAGTIHVDSTANGALRLTDNNSLGAVGTASGNGSNAAVMLYGGTAANGTLELAAPIPLAGINVSRRIFYVNGRDPGTPAVANDPHILNVAGNNTITVAGDWNTGTLEPITVTTDYTTANAATNSVINGGNWNFQSDSGKLTIAGGNIYNTANVQSTLQLLGAGDGQIDAPLNTYQTNPSLNLVKAGAGTWTLTNFSSTGGSVGVFSGTTTVNGGALRFNPALATTLSGNVDINAGGTFSAGPTAATALTLSATVNVNQGGALTVAAFNTSTTALSIGTLNLGSGTGGTLNFALAGTASNAPLSITSFATTGTNTINVSSTGSLAQTPFPLLSYTGSIGGAGFAGLTLGTLPSRVVASLVNNTGASTVDLNVTGIDTIRWNGNVNGNWDFGGSATANWRTIAIPGSTTYLQPSIPGEPVTFNDLAAGVTAIAIPATVSPGSVTFANSTKDYSFSGPGSISTGTFTSSGTGNATFTNAGVAVTSSFALNGTATTTFNTGTLTLPNALTLGSGSFLALNPTLPAQPFTLNGAISGDGTVRKEGANLVVLSGDNTNFAGSMLVNGGTLRTVGANAPGGAGLITVASGATLDIWNNGPNGPSTTSAKAVTISGTGAGTTGVAGETGGIGALVITQSAGASAHINQLNIVGDARIAAIGSTGASILWVDGPNAAVNGNGNLSVHVDIGNAAPSVGTELDFLLAGPTQLRNIEVAGGGAFYIGRATTLGEVSGSLYKLTLKNAGRLGIYASNSGAEAASTGIIDKPILVSNTPRGGGIELYLGNKEILSPIDLQGNLELSVVSNSGASVMTLRGPLTGPGNLALHTSANATASRVGVFEFLANDNAITGTITVGGGGVSLISAALVSANDRTTLSIGNGLESNGSLGTGNVVLNGVGRLLFARVADYAFPNIISGVGTVNASVGTVSLTGNNTYDGATSILAGSTISVGAGGTTGTLGSGLGAVANEGVLRFNRTDNALVVANVISGAGTVEQFGTGRTSLTGANTYTGPTLVSSGVLSIGNGGTTGTLGTGTVTTLGTLAFNRSNALAVTSAIGGTGGILQDGAGTTTLSGINNFTGTTTISQGVLSITGNSSAATGAVAVNGGATFGGTLTGTSAGSLGGAVTVTGGTIRGTILATAGTVPFTLPGGVTLNGGSLTFDLGTTPTAAPLATTAFSTVGAGANLVNIQTGTSLSNTTYPLVSYTGAIGGAGFGGLVLGSLPLRLAANLVNNSANHTVDLLVTGTDSIRWSGGANGTWDINGTQNWKTVSNNQNTVYLQPTIPGDVVNFDGVSVANTAINIAAAVNPASATFNNASPVNYSFSGAGLTTSQGMTFNGSGNVSFANSSLAVGGAFTKTGSGEVNIATGAFSVTGPFTVGGTGKVTIANTGTLTLPASIAVNSGTLAFSPAANVTSALVLTGAGTFRKEGPAVLTVSGDNSGFTGPVEVAGGTLRANFGNVNAFGTGNMASAVNGGILDINGTNFATLSVTLGIAGQPASGGTLFDGRTTSVSSHVNKVGLNADSTIGVAGPGFLYIDGAGASFTGNGKKLTMVIGANSEIDIMDAGDMGTGDIDVRGGGVFYVGGNTTLGPTSIASVPTKLTLGVAGGTTAQDIGQFGVYGSLSGTGASTSAIDKPIVVSDANSQVGNPLKYGGAINIYRGSKTIDSTIRLDGNLSITVFNSIGSETAVYAQAGAITGGGGLSVNASTNATNRRVVVALTSNANTYTGPTIIGGDGGGINAIAAANDRVSLSIGNGGTTGSIGAGDITINSSSTAVAAGLILNRGGAFTVSSNIIMAGAANGPRVTSAHVDGLPTLSGVISGTGRIIADAGSLTLAGNNTFTGIATTNGSGQIILAHNNALGAPGDVNVGWTEPGFGTDTSALVLTNDITSPEFIWLGGRSTFAPQVINRSGINTLSGTLLADKIPAASDRTYSLQSDGVGAANLFRITGTIKTPSATEYNIAGGLNGVSTFSFQGAGDGIVLGNIIEQNNNVINIEKNGAGQWTLAGTISHTGTTTVNAGTLSITGNATAATGAFTINAGGTLKGNSSINGQVVVNSGGTVRGGNSIGTITLSQGMATVAGSIIGVELGGAPPTGAPNTGASTTGSLPTFNTNSYIAITGGTTVLDPGIQILVDATNATLQPGTAYSFRVGQGAGNQNLSITAPGQFTLIGFAATPSNLSFTANNAGNMFVNFTMSPVPEPASILGMAGIGLLAFRRLRRKA